MLAVSYQRCLYAQATQDLRQARRELLENDEQAFIQRSAFFSTEGMDEVLKIGSAARHGQLLCNH